MRQPHRVHRVGASAVSAAVPVRKTADTPTRARQSSVFPGACVRGKHSAWPSTAPRPSRTCVGTLSGGSPNQMCIRDRTMDAETLVNTPLAAMPFVVSELIPQGLPMIGGAAKIGKSWLMLWLGLRIAKG